MWSYTSILPWWSGFFHWQCPSSPKRFCRLRNWCTNENCESLDPFPQNHGQTGVICQTQYGAVWDWIHCMIVRSVCSLVLLHVLTVLRVCTLFGFCSPIWHRVHQRMCTKASSLSTTIQAHLRPRHWRMVILIASTFRSFYRETFSYQVAPEKKMTKMPLFSLTQ